MHAVESRSARLEGRTHEQDARARGAAIAFTRRAKATR